MDKEQYQNKFSDINCKDNNSSHTHKESETRAARALAYAMDIRKFEIELYWKRATYFWTFIGAAFAAYALTYKTAADHEPWLSLLFSVLGFMFSFSWYLVNRGSKYWQNNWERHVDLLEDMSLGPLYKIIAEDKKNYNLFTSFLTSPGSFSVTKINQILSVFVTLVWFTLVIKSILPISLNLSLDYFKLALALISILIVISIYFLGRSSNSKTETELKERSIEIKPNK